MSRRLVPLLWLALTLACAGARPTADAAPQQRAFLWEARCPSGRPMYLTGSVHLGRPEQFSFPPSLEAAFAASDALVLELDPKSADPAAMQGTVMELGTYAPPDGLSKHVAPETLALLPKALESAGLPMEGAERVRPWLLATMLGVMELQRAGYSQAGGVEQLLLGRARGTKTVVELETARSQLEALAGLPDAVQDLMLREQLRQSGTTALMLTQMTSAWEGGNPDALAHVVFQLEDNPTYAPMYERLYFARNRAMADRLQALCAQPRTHFVAVGAAHLVGREGLPALLSKRGLPVRQLARDEAVVR